MANPTIDLPAGAYRIELTVNNGRADSAPATLTFTVGGGTSKVLPTAVVKGPTGVVRPDPATGLAKITLDGSQSSDPDKKALKYNWKCLTFERGSDGHHDQSGGRSRAQPAQRDLSDRADRQQRHGGFGARRPDDLGQRRSDRLDQGAEREHHAGCDNRAGPDRSGRLCLERSGQGCPQVPLEVPDIERWGDGDQRSIPWPVPSVNLRIGTYRIELTVNDGAGDSAPFAVMLTVGGTNKPPTAVIKGPSGTVRTDPATGLAKIALDGSQSSDPDKDILKYSWRCLTPTGEPTGITISPVARPSVDLRAGTYRIELTVNDGQTDSAPAAITVTAKENAAPTAVIKELDVVMRPDAKTGLAQIVLDGSLSSDPDGDTLKYRWRCLTASSGTTILVLDSVPSPSVRLQAGSYKIELIVNDGVTDSAPSTSPSRSIPRRSPKRAIPRTCLTTAAACGR